MTGATGFLGSYLLFELAQAWPEDPLRGLYRREARIAHASRVFAIRGRDEGWPQEKIERTWSRIEWVEADVLDLPALPEALQGAGEIYHCAARVSYAREDDDAVIHTNWKGTEFMLDTALQIDGLQRFVHISSTATLPSRSEGPIDESFGRLPERFDTAYALGKFRADMEAWRAGAEGLPLVVVNPAVILGPWVPGEGSSAVVETVARGLPYYPSGCNAFVDVRDVARFTRVLAADPQHLQQRFLVAGNNVDYKTLLQSIAGAIGVKPPQKQLSPFMARQVARLDGLKSALGGGEQQITPEIAAVTARRRTYDSSKARQATGLTFTPLDETLAWIARWRGFGFSNIKRDQFY